MALVYRLINRQEMEARRDDVLKVHRGAFSQWPHQIPEEELAEFGEYVFDLADLPGFRCMAALEDLSDRLMGFAFGWTSTPGHPWRDTVESALGPALAHGWLTDCFDLALIGVEPSAQGQGIGGCLHDHLLASVTHKTAVLSTLQDESAALQLFRNRGWETLRSDVVFPGGKRHFLLMGYALHR